MKWFMQYKLYIKQKLATPRQSRQKSMLDWRGGGKKIYRVKLDGGSSGHLFGIMGFYGAVEGNCRMEVVRSISLLSPILSRLS
ncbi:hypothetical protein Ddye_005678 [Dipteronia dyeriana]|uniref:Uncharacterized protein n=1 Tax=Dipteronia dyeriana TaxID=168575 RepID=A0AAD9XGK6_9ROSI|nr:hypothetical protein Ddye_005678 [Dipteronia dyeriana]